MAEVLTNMGQVCCPHGGVGSLAAFGAASPMSAGMSRVLTVLDVGPCAFACPSISPCLSIVSWIPSQQVLGLASVFVLAADSVPVTNNGPGRVLNPGQALLVCP